MYCNYALALHRSVHDDINGFFIINLNAWINIFKYIHLQSIGVTKLTQTVI